MTDIVVRVEHLSFSRGQRKIFDDVSFSSHVVRWWR